MLVFCTIYGQYALLTSRWIARTRRMISTDRRYKVLRFDKYEHIERDRVGGFYPVHLGDVLGAR